MKQRILLILMVVAALCSGGCGKKQSCDLGETEVRQSADELDVLSDIKEEENQSQNNVIKKEEKVPKPVNEKNSVSDESSSKPSETKSVTDEKAAEKESQITAGNDEGTILPYEDNTPEEQPAETPAKSTETGDEEEMPEAPAPGSRHEPIQLPDVPCEP